MGSQRYTPEFKDEAVRQAVDRGYSVAELVRSECGWLRPFLLWNDHSPSTQ